MRVTWDSLTWTCYHSPNNVRANLFMSIGSIVYQNLRSITLVTSVFAEEAQLLHGCWYENKCQAWNEYHRLVSYVESQLSELSSCRLQPISTRSVWDVGDVLQSKGTRFRVSTITISCRLVPFETKVLGKLRLVHRFLQKKLNTDTAIDMRTRVSGMN